MSVKTKDIIGNKYFLNVMALFIVGISVALCYVFYNHMATAYNRGQIDTYMDNQDALEEIQAVLDKQVKPAQSSLNYPVQLNSKGEVHSAIKDGNSLKQFVYNNCTQEVHGIYDEIVAYSEGQGIKPEIVFAITWSDSQCGHHLTTPNNYGNVGNNDRGARLGYFTPLEGFKAVIDTLNNKYMSGLVKVGDLSNGGRTGTNIFTGTGAQYSCSDAPMPYKCYATSTENWHNNILRALKVIGVQDVSAEWEFRV